MENNLLSRKSGYFVVIFTSKHSGNDAESYSKTAERMAELAQKQSGFLGMNSFRNEDGIGVTLSYWKDEEAIKAWKAESEHKDAQLNGRKHWYEAYRLEVCRVERAYGFGNAEGLGFMLS